MLRWSLNQDILFSDMQKLLRLSPEGVGRYRYILDMLWENRQESKEVQDQTKLDVMLGAVRDIYVNRKGKIDWRLAVCKITLKLTV